MTVCVWLAEARGGARKLAWPVQFSGAAVSCPAVVPHTVSENSEGLSSRCDFGPGGFSALLRLAVWISYCSLWAAGRHGNTDLCCCSILALGLYFTYQCTLIEVCKLASRYWQVTPDDRMLLRLQSN